MIGLDIGTSYVKFAQLKKSGRLTKLVGYGKIAIPENTIIEGIISEPEKLAEILKKSFANPPWGKISAVRVNASLPESKLFTRIIDLPKLENKDVEEAIKFEVDQAIPMPADDLYIDWQIIGDSKDKVTIFLSAAPKSIVNSYIQLFKIMEIEPMALEMSLASIARAMVSIKQKKEPVIILDIGDQASNMAVFDDNLRVTGSYPIGGATMKQRLAEELKTEGKKTVQDVRTGIVADTKSSKIVKEEIDKLVTEVKKMIEYYKEKEPNVNITKVLLCGGLGFMPGLPEYLKDSGFEAKIGNPWTNISIYPLKPVPKEEASSYAPAIGLCMRGLSDD